MNGSTIIGDTVRLQYRAARAALANERLSQTLRGHRNPYVLRTRVRAYAKRAALLALFLVTAYVASHTHHYSGLNASFVLDLPAGHSVGMEYSGTPAVFVDQSDEPGARSGPVVMPQCQGDRCEILISGSDHWRSLGFALAPLPHVYTVGK